MMKILCIGDLNADLLLPYGEAKRKVQNKNIDQSKPSEVTFQGGGSVANTARILGKLDQNPYFVTDLCNDSIGSFLKEEMEQMGVDMSLSALGNNSAIVCIAVVEEDGDRIIFPWSPPQATLPRFSKHSFEKIPMDDYLIFTGGMVLNNDTETMQEIYNFIKTLKDNTNSKFMFDLNMRKETYGLSDERKYYYHLYTSLADIIVGSGEEEFLPLTEKNTMSEALHYFDKEKVIIARNGSKPVSVLTSGKEFTIECEKVKPIHTIGAGDTFNGVFIYAYLNGCSIEECVRKANYGAGYMISHRGYLPLPDDIK